MASTDPRSPNVLLIFVDDMGSWAMSCAGTPEIQTPHLDRLAASGVRFENFFCTSPVCSPARASLLTGSIPSQHGVHDWIRSGNAGSGSHDYLSGQTCIHDALAEGGYRCGVVGKWHLGASDRPRPVFDTWYVHEKGGGPYYGAPMYRGNVPESPGRYLTDVLGDEATSFVEESSADEEPFYLNVSFTAPHHPWVDAHPEELTALYAGCSFPSIPRRQPHPWSLLENPETADAMRAPEESLRGYFAAVTGVDRVVGRLMRELDSRGLRDSTLIAFVGDNGFNTGHHGIWGKGNGTFPPNMFDTSIKVPAIFSHPGRIPAAIVDDSLLSGYDFAPTIADYAGVVWRADHEQPGRSFRARLEGTETSVADETPVVVFDEYGPTRMIRTPSWKYIRRHPDGPDELYDLERDPDEEVNLIDDPAKAARIDELSGALHGWFARYADPALDGAEAPVTGLGQILPVGLAGQPRDAFQQLSSVPDPDD